MRIRLHLVVVALVAGAAVPTRAAEQAPGDFEHEAIRQYIRQHHEAEMALCATLSENTRGLCQANAEGRREIAEARLALRAHSSLENLKNLARALAKARFRIETTLCAEQRGEAREACERAAQTNLARYYARIDRAEEKEPSSAAGAGR